MNKCYILKRDKSNLTALENLPIPRQKKDELYQRFDLNQLAYAVKFYWNQKSEPDDMGEFIEKTCERRLMKKQKRLDET